MNVDMSNYVITMNFNNSNEDIHSIFNWTELLPTLVISALTFIIGLIGNLLIIVTILRYRRMLTVTNLFLTSLACADLLLIIFCIPVKVAKLFSYTWSMGVFICKSVHYMQNVSAICSVLTLTAISIERYYAIVHPVKAKYICTLSHAKKNIFFIWIFSLLLATPTTVVQVHLPVGEHNELFYCVRNWDNSEIWQFHEVYLLVLILIVPFCIMSYSYSMICWEVWKVVERRSAMTNDKNCYQKEECIPHSVEGFQLTQSKRLRFRNNRSDIHTVKQVVYMLVAVVIVFAICWGPLLVDNTLTSFSILPHIRQGFLKYMSITFHSMAYFNSCINPLIYGFMSKSFRDSFLSTLCCSSEIQNSSRMGSYNNPRYLRRTGSQTRSTSMR